MLNTITQGILGIAVVNVPYAVWRLTDSFWLALLSFVAMSGLFVGYYLWVVM